MSQLETLLYFSLPVPSLRDARIALMLDCEYGQREGVLEIIKTQSRIFDDFTRVFPILKEYYGQKTAGKNQGQKAPQEKNQGQALKAALAQEKVYKQVPPQDRAKIQRLQKTFQGRIV